MQLIPFFNKSVCYFFIFFFNVKYGPGIELETSSQQTDEIIKDVT